MFAPYHPHLYMFQTWVLLAQTLYKMGKYWAIIISKFNLPFWCIIPLSRPILLLHNPFSTQRFLVNMICAPSQICSSEEIIRIYFASTMYFMSNINTGSRCFKFMKLNYIIISHIFFSK